jgi:ATP phosphoribosyltransferase
LFAARPRRHLADGWLTLTCPIEKVAALADWLVAQGAAEVTVGAPDYVFAAENKLYDRLAARLD